MKIVGAFVLGLVVAAGGAWLFFRSRPADSTNEPEMQAQVTTPATVEMPASPSAPPEPARPSPVGRRTAQPRAVAVSAQEPSANQTPAPEPASNPAPNPAPEPVASPEPQPQPVNPAPAPAPVRTPHTLTIPEGTSLTVALMEKISSETHKEGDAFTATLSQPLVVDGFVIAERNARVLGRVVESVRSGKVKGVAELQLELTSLSTSDGQKVKIATTAFIRKADTTHGKDAAKVGGGAIIGAAIGAIAGGGKGAAIGSGVGAGAGAGDVLLTRGKPAILPVETKIVFRLSQPVTITEKLN